MTTASRQELAEFIETHEWTIRAALDVYVTYMTENANRVQANYDAIKDDPAKRAAQDQSLVTVNGLRQAAIMFRDSAARAEKAHAALCRLTEGDEEEAGA